MPEPIKSLCFAVEEPAADISWRCNLKPHDDKVHAFVQFGAHVHEWVDE